MAIDRRCRPGWSLLEVLMVIGLFAAIAGPAVVIWGNTRQATGAFLDGCRESQELREAVGRLGRDVRSARQIIVSEPQEGSDAVAVLELVLSCGRRVRWQFVLADPLDRMPSHLRRTVEGEPASEAMPLNLDAAETVAFQTLGPQGADGPPGVEVFVHMSPRASGFVRTVGREVRRLLYSRVDPAARGVEQ